MTAIKALASFLFGMALLVKSQPVMSQPLDKIRLGYSGTGINNYVLDMGKRTGIFKKNGLDIEVVCTAIAQRLRGLRKFSAPVLLSCRAQ